MFIFVRSKNFDMAFGFLNQELAIDLGTANTIIYQNGVIVLDEPSIVGGTSTYVHDHMSLRRRHR